MPKFKVTTTAQVARVYYVTAAHAEEAENIVCEDEGDLPYEEDTISEEIDDCVPALETVK